MEQENKSTTVITTVHVFGQDNISKYGCSMNDFLKKKHHHHHNNNHNHHNNHNNNNNIQKAKKTSCEHRYRDTVPLGTRRRTKLNSMYWVVTIDWHQRAMAAMVTSDCKCHQRTGPTTSQCGDKRCHQCGDKVIDQQVFYPGYRYPG